jgi:hypothetical protein
MLYGQADPALTGIVDTKRQSACEGMVAGRTRTGPGDHPGHLPCHR